MGASTVLLDGSHDWLTPALTSPPSIRVRPKADRDCASVAGASVVAKVHRDALMVADAARWPQFGWDGNKGYGMAPFQESHDAHHRCRSLEVNEHPSIA